MDPEFKLRFSHDTALSVCPINTVYKEPFSNETSVLKVLCKVVVFKATIWDCSFLLASKLEDYPVSAVGDS